MLKLSTFRGYSEEAGPLVIPIHSSRGLEKLASPLLPEVERYIEVLRPSPDSQYVLVNAMGAGEYWGANVNADHFPEAALIHRPEGWTGNPLIDRVKAKDWAYGFPTFYYAHAFTHHRNKDASRAYGDIELAAWNDHMKRVELVVRVDKDKCDRFGGQAIWDKLRNGNYVDVSMGSKVPFDTCSHCLDWKKYREAQASYDPIRHKSPGIAVLEWMKKHGKIRGVAITREDYCDAMKRTPNRILDSGVRVFVYNDYPRFFDISFVFIGADKTAKVMMKLASAPQTFYSIGSAALADIAGCPDPDEKTASADHLEDLFKEAFLGKSAKNKRAEITKDVVPSQFAGKAVPALTAQEDDIPRPFLDLLGRRPLEDSLSTTAGMGIVLRPREFQRLALTSAGRGSLADEFDSAGVIFPKAEAEITVTLGADHFDDRLAKLLLPLLFARSALGPSIEQRVLLMRVPRDEMKQKEKRSSSHHAELLSKIGSAYNGYRESLLTFVSHSPALLASVEGDSSLQKFASVEAESLFTPLSIQYLLDAYWNEVG